MARKVRKSGKLVYGVGINDADYSVHKREIIDNKSKIVWVCPFYKTWSHMMERAYSDLYKAKRPTYQECTVIPEWHYFMTFRAWMIQQDWQGKALDKDLIIPGNKIYSPDKCCFLDIALNSFLTERQALRGEYPLGVSFHKHIKKFAAQARGLKWKKKTFRLF